MDLRERLTNVFRYVFHDDSITLNDDMTADDIEEWDSLSHVNLLLAIELEFGFEFLQREIQDLENVGALVSIIESKLA